MGPESDITPEEMMLGIQILKREGIKVGNFRLTGGEPLLHPEIEEIHRIAVQEWSPDGWLRVYSSGLVKRVLDRKKMGGRMKFAVKKPDKKKETHIPIMVSPHDLGIKAYRGFREDKLCRLQQRCGRCFDAFGFTGCPNAAALGRLFGIEVHSWEPQLVTSKELCCHCPHTMGQPAHVKYGQLVRDGKLEYPTKTYKWALARWFKRNRANVVPTRFKDRIPPEVLEEIKGGCCETVRP